MPSVRALLQDDLDQAGSNRLEASVAIAIYADTIGILGLTWHGDEPRILGPGRHYLMSPTHTLHSIRDISDPVRNQTTLS